MKLVVRIKPVEIEVDDHKILSFPELNNIIVAAVMQGKVLVRIDGYSGADPESAFRLSRLFDEKLQELQRLSCDPSIVVITEGERDDGR